MMSHDVDQFFRVTAGSVGESLPDDSAVAFVLDGEGGGVWTIRRTGPDVQIVTGDDQDVDCRLSCSVDDFRALLDGDLDGLRGFREGRLRIEGDIGLVLDLQAVLKA